MLNVGGMAYFIFAGFSLAALLSVRTSNPKIASNNMFNLLHSILLPRDQGPGKFLLMHVLSLWLTIVQTLEETDAAFGDNVTDREREHMEGICRELGLPVRALLNA
jgi:hypothetical protein